MIQQHQPFLPQVLILAIIAATLLGTQSFLPFVQRKSFCRTAFLSQVSTTTTSVPYTAAGSFIDSELRAAAMRLHTKEQSPKEGQAPSAPREPYVPTHADYLSFLVDSLEVYEAFEEVVNSRPDLEMFRSTGLERSEALKIDIEFMVNEFNLSRPPVGVAGRAYADKIRSISSVPEFVCHYYNFYFAHTAGGRMIGKQMSALLLDNRTLEFYEWEGDLNKIKRAVKDKIELLASEWSNDERDECTAATAAAFEGGGAINSYLAGGH